MKEMKKAGKQQKKFDKLPPQRGFLRKIALTNSILVKNKITTIFFWDAPCDVRA